jgi:hypothetical protein
MPTIHPQARLWHRKWSTWLALLSASATAGLGAYVLFPERLQGLIPDWALLTLGGVAMGAAMLVPVATSLTQQGLAEK